MKACNPYVIDFSFSDSNCHAKTGVTINQIININCLVRGAQASGTQTYL